MPSSHPAWISNKTGIQERVSEKLKYTWEELYHQSSRVHWFKFKSPAPIQMADRYQDLLVIPALLKQKQGVSEPRWLARVAETANSGFNKKEDNWYVTSTCILSCLTCTHTQQDTHTNKHKHHTYNSTPQKLLSTLLSDPIYSCV